MRSFDQIWAIAVARQGGAAALEVRLSRPKTQGALMEMTDDRWLSRVSQCVFNAGFNWSVVEAKWPGFEAAFHGFDVGRCAHLQGEAFDALLSDTRIVRHGAKIQSVQENAVFLLELAAEHGSAARAFATWPSQDYVGLLAMLKKRGSRLGGATGQYAMRFGGVDSFILSTDVIARLVAEGVVDKAPSSQSALRAVQEAFNTWAAQSGRSLTEISRVLAMSIG